MTDDDKPLLVVYERFRPDVLKAMTQVLWQVPKTPEDVAEAEAWVKAVSFLLPEELEKQVLDDLSQRLSQMQQLGR